MAWRSRQKLMVPVAAVCMLAAACSSSTGSPEQSGDSPDDAVPVATVRGPITGGEHGFPGTATPIDLDSADYSETEYFLSGTATSYDKAGEWSSNGDWNVTDADSADYTTRILVRSPDDPADFNGTVVVEWLNVSGNADVDVDFAMMHDEILRGGYAWVGVSAQQAGIAATGDSPLGEDVAGLKTWDPQRYADLQHPGDAYSYDIFSQVGQTLRHPGDTDPLEGLNIEEILAVGQSQSAFRLLTYTNAIQPVAQVYDGILIHSRDGTGAPLVGEGIAGGVPAPARIRTDLDIPVFQLETETDMYGLNGDDPDAAFPMARQPDTDMIRTWEVAGTSHTDAYYLKILSVEGQHQYADFMDLGPAIQVVNSGPLHYVAAAALRWLNTWAAGGPPPPVAEPYAVADGALVRDEHGNVVGGVRTPQLEVPVAVLTGEGAGQPGRTVPFDDATLTAMYPSAQQYMDAYTAATDDAIDAGFMLPEDRDTILDEGRKHADALDAG